MKCKVGEMKDMSVLTMPNGKDVSVDNELVDEVKYLWSLGIETNGCCCGHGEQMPYIGVYDEYIPLMLELGYNVHINCKSKKDFVRFDSFIAKSIEITDAMRKDYSTRYIDMIERFENNSYK